MSITIGQQSSRFWKGNLEKEQRQEEVITLCKNDLKSEKTEASISSLKINFAIIKPTHLYVKRVETKSYLLLVM
jgi:hypothetical protein